ncbi:hypothetical protein MTR62_07840 [Novosphingobium sp. 1949]|uniref:Uncharacterized protein n=1 Tax=Novosphingobium organovorum TaxID=2930092 RepID=A0ABT0BC23_9SPHN|nr:hypothetical protein [Novosphingobium organovorum]MCJ2182602.1 hypothetical protein [Novosphingobium organovorum]
MSLASVLLFPLVLLMPAVPAAQPGQGVGAGGQLVAQGDDGVDGLSLDAGSDQPASPGLWPDAGDDAWDDTPFLAMRFSMAEPQDSWQIRIEQRMTIRITPRAPMEMPRDMPADMPGRDGPAHFKERPFGSCIAAEAIAGVQPGQGNRLLLFTRDRRVVVAELEGACQARDFYSGFYLSHSSDGKVCVNRDRLQSRSGMRCHLTRLRELVEGHR